LHYQSIGVFPYIESFSFDDICSHLNQCVVEKAPSPAAEHVQAATTARAKMLLSAPNKKHPWWGFQSADILIQ
jgi:hypothetical protein